jgi:hypothetical protein
MRRDQARTTGEILKECEQDQTIALQAGVGRLPLAPHGVILGLYANRGARGEEEEEEPGLTLYSILFSSVYKRLQNYVYDNQNYFREHPLPELPTGGPPEQLKTVSSGLPYPNNTDKNAEIVEAALPELKMALEAKRQLVQLLPAGEDREAQREWDEEYLPESFVQEIWRPESQQFGGTLGRNASASIYRQLTKASDYLSVMAQLVAKIPWILAQVWAAFTSEQGHYYSLDNENLDYPLTSDEEEEFRYYFPEEEGEEGEEPVAISEEHDE